MRRARGGSAQRRSRSPHPRTPSRHPQCGNVSEPCAASPAWQPLASHGGLVQQWGGPAPDCIVKLCVDAETGAAVCCTRSCAVIAHTRPEYDFVAVDNPRNGGLVLRHGGMPAAQREQNQCGTDPVTGFPRARTLTT